MRIEETKIFPYNELSDSAKENAISEFRYVNVGHDWWENTYEDAANIGLKISAFGLDRRRHAEGQFTLDAEEVAQKIKADHGNTAATYNTATTYLEERKALAVQACQDEADEIATLPKDGWNFFDVTSLNIEYDGEILEDLEKEFLQSLLEDYSIILQNESEYLHSDEVVVETIEANEYEFTEAGDFYC